MSVYMVCVTVILGDVCDLKEHYFIISRRHICKHCEKITAATKQAAVFSATLHGLRVRNSTEDGDAMPQYTFMGYDLRSRSLLPHGYGDDFQAFFTQLFLRMLTTLTHIHTLVVLFVFLSVTITHVSVWNDVCIGIRGRDVGRSNGGTETIGITSMFPNADVLGFQKLAILIHG